MEVWVEKNDNIYVTYEICQNDTLTKNKIK